MSLSESEFYEAGMSLPPDVRKHVALRLLESMEVVGDDSFKGPWTNDFSSRVDAIVSGKPGPSSLLTSPPTPARGRRGRLRARVS